MLNATLKATDAGLVLMGSETMARLFELTQGQETGLSMDWSTELQEVDIETLDTVANLVGPIDSDLAEQLFEAIDFARELTDAA